LLGTLRETTTDADSPKTPFTAIGRSAYDWAWVIRALEAKHALSTDVDHKAEFTRTLRGLSDEFLQRNWQEILQIHPQAAVIDLAGLIMILQRYDLPSSSLERDIDIESLFLQALEAAAASRQPDLVGYEILTPLMLFDIHKRAPRYLPPHLYSYICSKWEEGVNKLLYLIKKTGTIFPEGVPTTFSAEMLPMIVELDLGSLEILCNEGSPQLLSKTALLKEFVVDNLENLVGILADKASESAGISGSPAASAAFLLITKYTKTSYAGAEANILNYITTIAKQDEQRGQPPFMPYSNFSFLWQLLPWLMANNLDELIDVDNFELQAELINVIATKLSTAGFTLGWDDAIDNPDIDDSAGFWALRIMAKSLGEKHNIAKFSALKLPELKVFARFEAEHEYICYPSQRGNSLSHIIHFLMALYAARESDYYKGAEDKEELQRMMDKVMRQLVEQHRSLDSLLSEKWHTSVYYPISRLMSLTPLYTETRQDYPPFAEMIDHLAQRLLREQHANGSWGKVGGTLEETAYALISLHTYGLHSTNSNPAMLRKIKLAISRGGQFIETNFIDFTKHNPPMWIVKSLYTPYLVVISHINYALQLARDVE
jgi:hypothetical protein